MQTPTSQKILISRHLETKISSFWDKDVKKVHVTLANIPATARLDSQGKPIHDPYLAADEEKYLTEHLVNPIAEVVGGFKAVNGLAQPHVILQFAQNSHAAQAKNESAPSKPEHPEKKEIDLPIETPRWNLDRVIIPPTTRNQLEVVLGLMTHHTLMYEEWDLKSVVASTAYAITLNFYGHSGTGKTLCAEAVAHHLGKKIMRVNYAQLESSLVGDTNKNIQQVFQKATKENCVLFFDEADSILGQRLSNVTQSADHAINMARSVMLIELERFQGVVIFATNFVQNYDAAFARRLLHFVRFDLPDLECRKRIFQAHLPTKMPKAADVSIDELASLTEELSGGDLRNVVFKAAAKAAKQDVVKEAKWVLRQHFLEAIEEVKEAKRSIKAFNAFKEIKSPVVQETESA